MCVHVANRDNAWEVWACLEWCKAAAGRDKHGWRELRDDAKKVPHWRAGRQCGLRRVPPLPMRRSAFSLPLRSCLVAARPKRRSLKQSRRRSGAVGTAL